MKMFKSLSAWFNLAGRFVVAHELTARETQRIGDIRTREYARHVIWRKEDCDRADMIEKLNAERYTHAQERDEQLAQENIAKADRTVSMHFSNTLEAPRLSLEKIKKELDEHKAKGARHEP
jgi:hypothetical protein